MQNHVPSTWDRMWALSIDGIILFVISMPLWFGFIPMMIEQDLVVLNWGRVLPLLSLSFLYDFLFVYFWGKTPGKWMIGLSIVPEDLSRKKPNLMESLIRSLMDRLTVFFGYAPYCFSWFRYDRTHILDWAAETRVVSVKPRVKRAKVRPVLATILILFFAWSGWRGISQWAASIHLSAEGVQVPGMKSALSGVIDPSEFQWNPEDFGSTDDGSKDKDDSGDEDTDSDSSDPSE